MKAILEFTPKHLEKAIDLARNVATFAQLEFGACVRMRIMDPAKVLHMDMILSPAVYKCEADFTFGINLHMFYKLLKSLHNDQDLEIEVDDTIMKMNQCQHYHTLVSQEVPFPTPELIDFRGYKVKLPTKLLQKYVRLLGNIAPVLELHYVPSSDTLFLESVNSMYRTLFSIDTGVSPNKGEEEYRKQFIIKFVDMAINPSLADSVELTFGDSLLIAYTQPDLEVLVTVAAHTEG